ncbi:MAG TPA: SNF2-related protein, partial [Tepidisphaeraceae bacterium]|nr:SNF2-related protein [Tepidisphaeraceae bacterium]
MNGIKNGLNLSATIERLAEDYERAKPGEFDFTKITWSNRMVTAYGPKGSPELRLHLLFIGTPPKVESNCSLCRGIKMCQHAKSLVIELNRTGIAQEIEERDYAPADYTIKANSKQARAHHSKAQLNQLVERFKHHSPNEPAAPKFPANRELIYVINAYSYSTHNRDAFEISLATRSTVQPKAIDLPSKDHRGKSNTLYRSFTQGIRAWSASLDPLDQEIAEKVALTANSYSFYSGSSSFKFHLVIEKSLNVIARLARSGRLYFNTDYGLHDDIHRLSWLDDEPFELKYEITQHDARNVRLGVCAANSTMQVSHNDLSYVAQRYLVDKNDRLGIFRKPAPIQLIEALLKHKQIVVPRAEAAEFIARVMSIPFGLGIEFVGCEDIRPTQLESRPRARIKINAPTQLSDWLDGTVEFDYEGVLIPLKRAGGDFYDQTRNAIVKLDHEFHNSSQALLKSNGVKINEHFGDTNVKLPKKKLPAIVARLIQAGWHVEADGKLYRTGSKFEMKVGSGIDWFELQGKAHFDQTSIDLPRLLQSLKAGQNTVVLDDGTIGLIPEEWLKKFGGLTELATSDDGRIKFGRSQVGLLDALLAEQGEIDVDEKFAAARDSLRAFDRILPQEAPAGFVGELRPYQKLSQGWFEFLRNLSFGGCLADDMGLGKTIQVLAMLERRRKEKSGPSLIVVPRSLIFNWTAEAKKFAPKIRVLDQSHAQRTRGTDHLSKFDIVLTTYGTLRRDAAFLKDFEFDYVILDEAQAIKNAATEASKAARLLRGKHKLALSGTPIENHLGELWSLFDFLNPGMLGRVGRFAGFADDADMDQRKLLANAVRPFILRRTKKQVAPELPDRIEQTVIVELDSDQRKSYDELREHYRKALLQKIDSDGIGKSQIVILEALLRLRQAAC